MRALLAGLPSPSAARRGVRFAAAVATVFAPTLGCAARNGFLEVAVPLDDAALGLVVQAQVRDPSGSVRSLGPAEIVQPDTSPARYSLEGRSNGASFRFEVCLCEPPSPGSGCFDASGTCLGASATASQGGLYTFGFERAIFVGERTRWQAEACGGGGLRPLASDRRTCAVEVSRCDVEGCCGSSGCGGVDRRAPRPFCWVDRDLHLCETAGPEGPLDAGSASPVDGGGA